MSVIRMPQDVWTRAHAHLFDGAGEHFAFFMAKSTSSRNEPVFMVHDVILVPDGEVNETRSGLELTTESLLRVMNRAVSTGSALVEAHNHGGQHPRFSCTDINGLTEFSKYVLETLPGRPYAATVWGDHSVFGEWFDSPPSRSGTVRSILIVGSRLRQVVSRDGEEGIPLDFFDRQLPWFTEEGQRQLGRLRAGIVGLGGVGAQIAQNLAYLGVRDFTLVEDKRSDISNMNRLVTAVAADVDTPKAILARRLIKSIAPRASVRVVETKIQSQDSLDDLKGVDVMFGCVDNDGGRLVMNELALAYELPYFDTAVSIDAEGGIVDTAGGRVAVVLPGGPCLVCMGEIDRHEAAYFLSSRQQQEEQRERGYVRGVNVHAPSVVSLNAMAAAVATNEFAVFASGIRSVSAFTEVDLLGSSRTVKSQWVVPTRYSRSANCVACLAAGRGDASGVDRYDRSDVPAVFST